jgi:hypothetical protein
MAITIPNVFVAGTRIESAPVNANFAAMSNALDKTGDTLTGNLAVGTGITIDGLDISTVPQSGGVFNPNAITFTNIIIGAATTSGIRLDLESGTLAVREGDDSAYGPMLASVYNVPTGGSLNFNEGSAALAWDTTDSTATLALNANVSHRIGAQELVRVINRTGTAIAKGKAVYIVGSNGTRVDVALADASAEATAATTLGITAESIADGAEGFVCVTGLLRAVTTTGLTEGQIVWLSETAGGLTSTRPTQPAHGVFMGLCVKAAGAGGGILYVSVINGQELDELHDVLITTPAANQILKRNSGNTLWENAAGAALTKTDDTNVTLTLGGSASTALVNAASLTLGWTGTLASTRLNSNVVQAITNDTNVTGSISAQTLTLGWTGTLGATRLNSNVVQSVTNDTNVTGSISTQALTLGWTGQLALSRGGTGASTAQGAINALAGATTSGQYLRGDGSNITLSAIQAGDVPTLNQNTTGTAAGLSSTLAVASGGTGQTSYTDGQLLIGNTATTSLSKATLTAGSGVTITNGNGTITIAATGSGGTVTGVTATSPVASSGGTAPVISLSSAYGDTLNPYGSKTANYVLAAPDGSPGTPSFRALLAADIPTLNQNTTGTAAGLSSTLAVSSGGTGQTSYTDGQLLIGNSTGNTLSKATLTAGSGISITNGNGSITIASTGGGGSGTVTSVSGTGTVNGLTLSGTVTTTGDLTLSGTVDSMSALAGSASAPSIAASGDTNTGIYFPAADTIGFTTGGTEWVKINSTGRLLVGGLTTGVGGALEVLSGAQITRFVDSASGGSLRYNKARGTESSPTIVQTSDVMASISGHAYDGAAYLALSELVFRISDVTSATNMSSSFQFYTTSAGTARSIRMTLTPEGNLALNSGAKLLLDSSLGTGDTFISQPSNDVITLTTGGTERVRINASGRMLVNMTTDNMGLPLYALRGAGIVNFSDTIAPEIYLRRTRGSEATPTTVATNDELGNIWFQAYGGTNYRSLALIRTSCTTYTSDTDMTTALRFYTTNASTTVTERFRVSGAGDIAIDSGAKLLLDSVFATGDTYVQESSANVMALVTGGTTALSLAATAATLGMAGSASVPALTTTGDSNTGVFFPAADEVAITTGGVERLRVDSSGFVGIGVVGTLVQPIDMAREGSVGIRQSRFSTDALGVNTTARKARGTQASPLAVASADLIGGFFGAGYGGTNYRTLASVQFYVNNYTSDTNMSGDIRFSTTNAGTSPSERMRLTPAGDVAINATNKILLDGVAATGDTYLTETSANNIAIFTGGSERLRLDGSGNVGVNVTSFGTSAAGVLAVKNGTEPTSGPADTVQIYSVDRSAGNTIPAIYCEGSGVTNAGITSTAVTHKIAIKVNGTVYYLLATTNAT